MPQARHTGYEIIPFSPTASLFGFGVLEQWGYIDEIPEPYEWREWDPDTKRLWVVEINRIITERLQEQTR